MDNNNDNKPTLSHLFELHELALQGVRDAEATAHESLRNIAREHGKTFTHEGQLFQVRERLNKDLGKKVPYIVKLERSPKEWLAAAREAKIQAEVDKRTGTEQDVVDGVHGTEDTTVSADTTTTEVPAEVVV